MCEVGPDIMRGQVDDSEEVLTFSEEEVVKKDVKDLDLELTCVSQVDITGGDTEDDSSQIISIGTSQIEIIPEEDKNGGGDTWKVKFEKEHALRKNEMEKKERAERNLKHARGCCCDLRVQLRNSKRRCLEKEDVIRKIIVLSQEDI